MHPLLPALAVALFWALAALCLFGMPLQGLSQTRTVPVNEVEAAYLFNFVKYVEWPASAFEDEESPIVIGVLGQDPFGPVLEKSIAGRSIGKRKVEIRRSRSSVQGLKHSHILFISASERNRLQPIIAQLKGTWALTVGETPDFLDYGMVAFTVENQRVRFDVNLKEAQEAGLRISARMLDCARRVEPKK